MAEKTNSNTVHNPSMNLGARALNLLFGHIFAEKKLKNNQIGFHQIFVLFVWCYNTVHNPSMNLGARALNINTKQESMKV